MAEGSGSKSGPRPQRNDGTFHRFVKPPKAPIVHSTKDNLQVLYEDNHIVAVNKRSGDVVQGRVTSRQLSHNEGSFGCERALILGAPSDVTVTAETDGSVWTLSKQDFHAYLSEYVDHISIA